MSLSASARAAASRLLRSKRYWIFDLDGTLAIPLHNFAEIREILGIPKSEDILGYVAAQPAEVSASMHRTLEEWERKLAVDSKVMEGCHDLLTLLAKRQCSFGIVTRNTRDNAMLTLDVIRVTDLVDPNFVLGRHEAQPKPEPDALLKLMGQWGAQPSETVMVGDFSHDLAAGRHAGVHTVHINYKQGETWPDLTDVHVTTLTELVDLLQEDSLVDAKDATATEVL